MKTGLYALSISTVVSLVLTAGHAGSESIRLSNEAIAASGSASMVGQPCDTPISEVCTDGADNDGNGLVDCLDPQCNTGNAFLCSAKATVAPACQPILDDPARIRFKKDPRLDLFKVNARTIPVTAVDPEFEDVQLSLSNLEGPVFFELVGAGFFVANKKGNRWIYKVKKNGTQQIYRFVIRERLNRKTSELEYFVRWSAEADLAQTDPTQNTLYTESELSEMAVQLVIGDDPFLIIANWDRKKNGWYLPDKYF